VPERAVAEINAGPRDLQAGDPDGAARLRLRGGSRSKPGEDVREIEGAAGIDHDAGVEAVELDVAQHPVAAERPERVEPHIEAAPSEEGTPAVPLQDAEVLQRQRQHEGIHAHLADGDGPVELGREAFLGLYPDDGWEDEKARNPVQNHAE
jgi:hypothetical protein